MSAHDPNANRPGYKETKVGWIPEEWECSELHNLVDRRRPICYGVVQTGEDLEDGIPCVRVTDLVEGTLDPRRMIKTSTKIHRQYRRTTLEECDVMVALRGEAGKAVEVPASLAGSNLTRGVALLSKRHGVSSRYLVNALAAPATSLIFRRAVNGTALQEISIGTLKKVSVAIPPLPEQMKIAQILLASDDTIETTAALLGARKRQKRALMQQLLTGRKRLSGFKGEWSLVRLHEITKRLKQVAEDPGRYPVLSITAGTGFVSQEDKFSRVIAGKQVENYVVLKRGEFSYNKGNSSRFPQGCVYRLEEYDEGLVPNVFYSFKILPKVVDSELLKQYFLAGLHNRDLYRWINSGVRNNGLLNLNSADFFKLPILLPALDEQKAIGAVLRDADREISLLEDKLRALKKQKRSLMQKLLTGQVRVKVSSDSKL